MKKNQPEGIYCTLLLNLSPKNLSVSIDTCKISVLTNQDLKKRQKN